MRTNCKGRAFLSQSFIKRMQTACYFVWPTLKFGEKKAEKCQSMNFALLSSGPSAQFSKWVIPSNCCCNTSSPVYDQSQDHLEKWSTGARLLTHMGFCNSIWHQEFLHDTQQGKAKQLPRSTLLSASAQLCNLEVTFQRAITGCNISIGYYTTASAEKATVQYLPPWNDKTWWK